MSAVASRPARDTKRRRLVYLLDHWPDIFDPDHGRGGNGDGPGIGPCMPRMSRHPSVVELARCLELLRVEAPSQFGHLVGYYGAEWRIREDEVRRRRKGGKQETVRVRQRVRLVPRWVRLENVRRGEEFLASVFRGPVFVPDELRDGWDG